MCVCCSLLSEWTILSCGLIWQQWLSERALHEDKCLASCFCSTRKQFQRQTLRERFSYNSPILVITRFWSPSTCRFPQIAPRWLTKESRRPWLLPNAKAKSRHFAEVVEMNCCGSRKMWTGFNAAFGYSLALSGAFMNERRNSYFKQ